MRYLNTGFVAFLLASLIIICGWFSVTSQGRANADLDNSFVAHRNSSLDILFSRPLANADPYFEPRMLSWRREARGFPRPWFVRDHSPDGAFYYALLEGRVLIMDLLTVFFPLWICIQIISSVRRERKAAKPVAGAKRWDPY